MERTRDLSLFLLISLGLHLVLTVGIFMPGLETVRELERRMSGSNTLFRDITVNINQNDQRRITERTMLSDRDSTESGYITRERGDNWLNNSRYFNMRPGRAGDGSPARGKEGSRMEELTSERSRVYVYLGRGGRRRASVKGTDATRITIPDRDDITKKNAIYYSNSGLFSFNTAKFKDFEYFRKMKDRIANHWHPPLLANSSIGGWAPGRTRIMAIPSQYVKIAFVLNRQGDVVSVHLVDSLGNRPLDESCIDAIRNSKSFGPVPDSLKGRKIVIPFMFGYNVR